MNIEEIKQVFSLAGRKVTPSVLPDRYRVDGIGKHWSLEALEHEAKFLIKQHKKAVKRGIS